MSRINILALVDVVGALSTGTPMDGNVCLIDDSDLQSSGQGTVDLCTRCRPGDLVKWSALAADVQTPVAIRSITFLGEDGTELPPLQEAGSGAELDLKVWEGIVPSYLVPGTSYRYRLELQMYEGDASLMRLETPSLMCPT